MEKLKAMKEKFQVRSTESLKEFARTRIPPMEDNLKYKDLNLSESSAKIQELKSDIAALTQALNNEEHTLHVKQHEYITACDTLKELEEDRNRLLLEVHQLESQRNHLKNKKPNPKDEELLRNGNQRYHFYKQLTGIRWDWGAPEGTIKGYVTNGKEHIHTFVYQNKDKSTIENEIWKHVAKGTGLSKFSESDCDENTAPNKQ